MSKDPDTCPGISKFVRPLPEYFSCLHCGGRVEIWTDESTGVCENCEKESPKPMDNRSCLDWCEFADKCRDIIEAKKRPLMSSLK